MTDEVEMYADGACLGNPGPGGWGTLLRFRGQEKSLAGAEPHTTNNRMELMAVIEGLKALTRPVAVTVYTDSRYVQQGIQSWLPNWKKKNWRTAGGQAVKNQDLWQELDAQAARHKVSWQWVPGHAGVEGNERADQLARQAAKDQKGSA